MKVLSLRCGLNHTVYNLLLNVVRLCGLMTMLAKFLLSLLKILTCQSQVRGEKNTFAVSDIREAFLNLYSVEFLSHPNFPEELSALPI